MNESVKQSENIIVACVYVSDANKCLEQFQKLKKKIKGLLPKDLYKHIILTFINDTSSILSLYNSKIKMDAKRLLN